MSAATGNLFFRTQANVFAKLLLFKSRSNIEVVVASRCGLHHRLLQLMVIVNMQWNNDSVNQEEEETEISTCVILRFGNSLYTGWTRRSCVIVCGCGAAVMVSSVTQHWGSTNHCRPLHLVAPQSPLVLPTTECQASASAQPSVLHHPDKNSIKGPWRIKARGWSQQTAWISSLFQQPKLQNWIRSGPEPEADLSSPAKPGETSEQYLRLRLKELCF